MFGLLLGGGIRSLIRWPALKCAADDHSAGVFSAAGGNVPSRWRRRSGGRMSKIHTFGKLCIQHTPAEVGREGGKRVRGKK